MNKKIPVYWMHCKSCELNLENNLSKIWWVKINKVSQAKNFIDIDISWDETLDEVNKIIEKLWYHTEKKDSKKNNFKDYLIIFLIFIVFWVLYFSLKDIKLFNELLTSKNLSFTLIFLIWIVASVSTCLAVTWWIVLGFSKYLDNSNKTSTHIQTQLKFHLWRVFWYALGWWFLWLLWWYMWTLGILNKVLLFLSGFVMLYMWLNILKIVPSLSSLGVNLPNKFWHKILNIKNPAFAPIIWALTFFLPCWFTQAMQIYAASSSSFISGAMIMWIFALWTMPVLFLIGFWSSYFFDKNFNLMNKIIWVLVFCFWLVILWGFLNMIHFNLPQTNVDNTEINQNLEDIKQVTVTYDGYWFWDVILEWAKNYKLTINPTADGVGCLYALTIPWIDEKEYLVKKWLPIVINIENAKPWKYKAVCTAMWMKQGSITIK